MRPFCCAADCEEADDLVNATTLTPATAADTTAADAAVVIDDDANNDDSPALLRLLISPQPNDDDEIYRAVGSSVVFTCQRVVAHVDGDDHSAAEATTIEWFDKNDMRIPSQTR